MQHQTACVFCSLPLPLRIIIRLSYRQFNIISGVKEFTFLFVSLYKNRKKKKTVLVYQVNCYMSLSLIKKYRKGLRNLKSRLLTFSSLYKKKRRAGCGGGKQPCQGRWDIYNKNGQVARRADGKELYLIIGSIKALLKCGSLLNKPSHCPFAHILDMVIQPS